MWNQKVEEFREVFVISVDHALNHDITIAAEHSEYAVFFH